MKNIQTLFVAAAVILSAGFATAQNRVGTIKVKEPEVDNGSCFPWGSCDEPGLSALEYTVNLLGGPMAAERVGISKSFWGKTYTVPVITNDDICERVNSAREGETFTLFLAPNLSKALINAGGISRAGLGIAITANNQTPVGIIEANAEIIVDARGLCN